jgi:V8-like Glu-specific endopeptidase
LADAKTSSVAQQNGAVMAQIKRILLATTVVLTGAALVGLTQAQAQNGVTSHPAQTSPAAATTGPGRSRLPLISESVFPVGGVGSALTGPAAAGAPGAGPAGSGGPGSASADEGDEEVEPSAFGTFNWPYTHARVANTNLGFVDALAKVPVTGYPFRPTGKLLMTFGTSTFVCSASLIKKGLLVTAAHCVHNYGQGNPGFATNVRFYPANI